MNHLQVFADTFEGERDVTAPSRRGLGWFQVFECLKDGLRNGGSVDWSGSARSAVHGLTAHRLIQKARGGFPARA